MIRRAVAGVMCGALLALGAGMPDALVLAMALLMGLAAATLR